MSSFPDRFLLLITLRFRLLFRQCDTGNGQSAIQAGCDTMRHMRTGIFRAGVSNGGCLPPMAAGPLGIGSRPFEIYFVDVEGGQSTLIVSPSGQSMLIDTGWRGFEGRDADRIVQAAKAARIKQIDYLLITHYHRDHVGGVPQLADRMKILNFLDHGPNTEDSQGDQGRLQRLREDHAARRT